MMMMMKMMMIIIIIIIIIIILTAIGFSPGGSGYFTCTQILKKVTRKFKSEGQHERHVVATWKLGNRLSIRLQTQGNQEKPVSQDLSDTDF